PSGPRSSTFSRSFAIGATSSGSWGLAVDHDALVIVVGARVERARAADEVQLLRARLHEDPIDHIGLVVGVHCDLGNRIRDGALGRRHGDLVAGKQQIEIPEYGGAVPREYNMVADDLDISLSGTVSLNLHANIKSCNWR